MRANPNVVCAWIMLVATRKAQSAKFYYSTCVCVCVCVCVRARACICVRACLCVCCTCQVLSISQVEPAKRVFVQAMNNTHVESRCRPAAAVRDAAATTPTLASQCAAAQSHAETFVRPPNSRLGELVCSISAWPFLRQPHGAPPPPNQSEERPAHWPLCDGSRASFAGAWAASASTIVTSAYLAAIHNATSWDALPAGATGRHGSCSRCRQSSAAAVFRPARQCRRLSVHEAVARLRTSEMTIVGDSSVQQLWTAVAAVSGAQGSRRDWPEGLLWFCIPETTGVLEALAKRSRYLWRPPPRHRDDDSVLLISLGA